MSDSVRAGREKRLVLLAIAIILVGVAVGILHRLDVIPLWASTLSTVIMAVAAIYTALAAARAYRNGADV